MPDRSGGTIDSTADVTATSASPRPNPTSASAAASAGRDTFFFRSASTAKMPPAESRHPRAMGERGPRAAVQRPATWPATTIATAIARNWSAIFAPENFATTCR